MEFQTLDFCILAYDWSQLLFLKREDRQIGAAALQQREFIAVLFACGFVSRYNSIAILQAAQGTRIIGRGENVQNII